jgi:hypothetical protein
LVSGSCLQANDTADYLLEGSKLGRHSTYKILLHILATMLQHHALLYGVKYLSDSLALLPSSNTTGQRTILLSLSGAKGCSYWPYRHLTVATCLSQGNSASSYDLLSTAVHELPVQVEIIPRT